MSEAVLIKDEQKLNLSPEDLFDKIINLKINCYDVNTQLRESFVIRSDYEMIYPEVNDVINTTIDGTVIAHFNKKYLIRRCTMKPSIKVKCKMVTSNLGTTVEVFVTNFFMLTKDGKHLRSFNNSQYQIESVEIAMGYWGQFRIGRESDYLVPSYDEFFTIEAKNGADKITIVDAIVVTTDKLPPDSVLHIKGYVGEVYSSPVAVSNVSSIEKAVTTPVASSSTGIEQIMFDNITRRYLNKHYLTDSIMSKKISKKNIRVSDIETYGVAVNYDHETGLLFPTDATTYGVKVFLSERAKKIIIPKTRDSDGNYVDKSFYFEAGWTIGQTIARLASFLHADLNYTFNTKGDVLIYLSRESTDVIRLYKSYFK